MQWVASYSKRNCYLEVKLYKIHSRDHCAVKKKSTTRWSLDQILLICVSYVEDIKDSKFNVLQDALIRF